MSCYQVFERSFRTMLTSNRYVRSWYGDRTKNISHMFLEHIWMSFMSLYQYIYLHTITLLFRIYLLRFVSLLVGFKSVNQSVQPDWRPLTTTSESIQFYLHGTTSLCTLAFWSHFCKCALNNPPTCKETLHHQGAPGLFTRTCYCNPFTGVITVSEHHNVFMFHVFKEFHAAYSTCQGANRLRTWCCHHRALQLGWLFRVGLNSVKLYLCSSKSHLTFALRHFML